MVVKAGAIFSLPATDTLQHLIRCVIFQMNKETATPAIGNSILRRSAQFVRKGRSLN